MHNVLHVKCSQWPWHGLCCCCNLWHRWHQESAGQDLLELPLCSLALQDLNSGHEIPNAASPFCPFSQKGNLGACESGFAGAVCVRARAPVPLSCCCLPRHLRHGAVFCWAWVTLAEMSAEPALALSAFTVSCKVNRMLLCGGKCYSLKSSWRRLSIRPVQKWASLRGFCSAEALQCVQHQGAVQHHWGARPGCSGCHLKPSLCPTGWGCCHPIEWDRVWHSELGEAMSCAL